MDQAAFDHPARWWHRFQDGRVVCELCPRGCKLREGERGVCFVRQARGGAMVLTTYGLSSGFCIDPIEKKPLNHFHPGSSVLSFGTAGCNLGCRFCQNWDISKAREMARLSAAAGPEQIAQTARRQGCRSVAFTYNDPVVFAEYAIDTARACHALDVKTVAVTAGYISEPARADFFGEMDAANVDLKGFSEDFYRRLCLGALAPVLETLKFIKSETRTWLELTTLLIPGENDSDAELHAMTEWIVEHLGADVPLHFTAFHPDYKMTDLPPTGMAALKRARQIARGKGIHYVYTGNVHDSEGASTFCPGCGKLVIERDWYQLGAYHIKGGSCEFCGTPIAGWFEDAPGGWGGGRRPVEMGA